MATKTKSPRSFANSSALSRFRRVTLSGGVLAYADGSTAELGTLRAATQTTDANAAVNLINEEGTTIMVASGAITQYADVFADVNGKVAATGTIFVGIALDAATADGDEIEVLRKSRHNGKLFTQTVASSAVTNTTAETAFDQSYTIPANLLKAGDRLRIRAAVIATATNSTDTLTVKLKVGANVLITTVAVDVANNDVAFIDMDLVVRTAGGTGTMVAAGQATLKTSPTTGELTSTTIDTTATNAITLTATWSVANAGDSCRLDMLSVDRTAA